jgi:hypothetical protein
MLRGRGGARGARTDVWQACGNRRTGGDSYSGRRTPTLRMGGRREKRRTELDLDGQVSLTADAVHSKLCTEWTLKLRSADKHVVLAGSCFSITLEVLRGGKTRWLVTEESGRAPECAERGGPMCGCEMSEGGGAAWRRSGYAIVKMGRLFGSRKKTGSCGPIRIAPLSSRSMKGLKRVAKVVRGSGADSLCLARVADLLAAGGFCGEEQCECGGWMCGACKDVRDSGVDARWCCADEFVGGLRCRTEFPWFRGVTDGIGTVHLGGRVHVPWLLCSTSRRKAERRGALRRR